MRDKAIAHERINEWRLDLCAWLKKIVQSKELMEDELLYRFLTAESKLTVPEIEIIWAKTHNHGSIADMEMDDLFDRTHEGEVCNHSLFRLHD